MDHAAAAVVGTLAARLLAGAAADAAARVDEEAFGHAATRSIRTADTLKAGMPDSGSNARSVSWFAERSPGQ